MKAYNNRNRTQTELEAAVTAALTSNEIDISKYKITVTTKGVDVSLKDTGGYYMNMQMEILVLWLIVLANH